MGGKHRTVIIAVGEQRLIALLTRPVFDTRARRWQGREPRAGELDTELRGDRRTMVGPPCAVSVQGVIDMKCDQPAAVLANIVAQQMQQHA